MFKSPLLVSFLAITLLTPATPTLALPANQNATSLLDTLKETRSMTKVGFNTPEYLQQVRKIQVQLDRFLESEGAIDYPAGNHLKSAAEWYVQATIFFPGGKLGRHNEFIPQYWKLADLALESAQQCHKATNNKNACQTIRQAGEKVTKSH
jgi:hypothetical protein